MGRNHLLIAAGIAAGVIAIAAFLLLRDDTTQPDPEQPTTVATQATTTTAAAADPPTTTAATVAESTTTTAAAEATTTVEEPPAQDTTTEEPTTTSTVAESTTTTAAAEATTTTTAAAEEPPAEDGTTEEPTTSTTEPLPEPGSVTSLPPVSSSGCGSFRGWAYMVKDQCLLDIAKVELTKFYAGTHAERMDSIRDGHVLGSVFTGLQTYIEAIYGTEQANDLASPYSLYADADARHLRSVAVCCAEWRHQNLVSVRFQLRRVGILEGGRAWSVAPFTRVDGQWKIDYTGFCRLVTNFGFGVECPPDPRPGVVGAPADELSVATYKPVDDPNRESRHTYGW